MIPDIAQVCVGALAIAIGTFLVWKRAKLTRAIADGVRGMYGRLGEKSALKYKPSGLVLPGITFMVIGLIFTINGIARLVA